MQHRTGPVDLADALAEVTEHWTPKVVARVNDQYVVLVETVTTAHTGSEQTDRTVPIERQLG